MRRAKWNPSIVEEIAATRRPFQDPELERTVASIIADVRDRGEEALLAAARQFDAPNVESVLVSDEEIDAAEVLEPIELAAKRIEAFHERQLAALTKGWREAGDGWEWGDSVGQRMLPIAVAGVYVPGGAAAYPSSVLMNGLPAAAAGVEEVVVCTPAAPDGNLPAPVLSALRRLGEVVDVRAYKVGGAAAIAAMALGAGPVPRADVVVGPGNRYVNEAKRQLWGFVGLDGYAGPSEVCVVVDAHSNARYAAADLLTQIEHAPDNRAFLIGIGQAPIQAVLEAVRDQLQGAPRAQTMIAALEESWAIEADTLEEACEIANVVAPEHLTLAVGDPAEAAGYVRNAGCILFGEFTPESAGDYAAGPSHTLPTSGAARFSSPVNVATFLRFQSGIWLSRAELEGLRGAIEGLGALEGFPQHARGASIRFEE